MERKKNKKGFFRVLTEQIKRDGTQMNRGELRGDNMAKLVQSRRQKPQQSVYYVVRKEEKCDKQRCYDTELDFNFHINYICDRELR